MVFGSSLLGRYRLPYDSYRSAVLPANLIQAQRDYFGAHTYKRIDKEGIFHTGGWNNFIPFNLVNTRFLLHFLIKDFFHFKIHLIVRSFVYFLFDMFS